MALVKNYEKDDIPNTAVSSVTYYSKVKVDEYSRQMPYKKEGSSNNTIDISFDEINNKEKSVKSFTDEFGNYDSNKLNEIISVEWNRDKYGNKTEKRYSGEDELINDLELLKERYKDFPNFIYYNQNLYKDSYGDTTIQYGGCCPTCFAMVASYLKGREITPTEVAPKGEKYYFSNLGTDVTGNYFPDLCEEYDMEPTMLTDWRNPDTIRAALENKNPIILNVVSGDFTGSGHYIVLLGLDEHGEVIVADPNGVGTSTRTYTIESLINQTHDIGAACWMFENKN